MTDKSGKSEAMKELSPESEFMKKLEHLINDYGLENESNTPDYILALYLRSCLVAYNNAIRSRERYRGKP